MALGRISIGYYSDVAALDAVTTMDAVSASIWLMVFRISARQGN